MIRKITLFAVLSLLVACLLTGVGVLGLFGPLHYILEPGTFLCRKFIDSQNPDYWDGGMITPVIWTNITVYALLLFAALIFAARIRKSEGATS